MGDRTFSLLRRASAMFVCAWVAAWVPAIAVRFLGAPREAGLVMLVVAILVGGYVGYRQPLDPMGRQERRDAVVGWSVVIGLAGAIVAMVLPMPWRVVAALAWIGLVVVSTRLLLAGARPPAARADER